MATETIADWQGGGFGKELLVLHAALAKCAMMIKTIMQSESKSQRKTTIKRKLLES
jgi:hypothetical protein